MPVGEKQTYRFGPFELDTQCGQLRKGGVGLKLQGQPVQILEILLEHPGQLVTREELRERLWASGTFVDFDHSLNTAIKKLRQALGDEAGTHRYIETLPRRGYRFIEEVNADEPTQEDCGASQPLVDDVASKTAATSGDAAVCRSTIFRKRRFSRTWAVPVLVTVPLVAAITAHVITGSLRMPHVVASRALTSTVNRKAYILRPLVDRGSVYFLEQQQLGIVNRQVPTTGGEERGSPINDGLAMDISRDGTQLLFLTGDPTLRQHDVWMQPLPAGTPRLVVKDASVPIWSADGRSIFFTNGSYTALYRAKSDGTDAQPLAELPFIKFPHLSPDGKRIRFTGNATTIWEVGVDGKHLHPILAGRSDVLGGSWSPDGRYYFFSGWDGERWSLWTVSEAPRWWSKPSPPVRLTSGPLSFLNPAISKDGKQL